VVLHFSQFGALLLFREQCALNALLCELLADHPWHDLRSNRWPAPDRLEPVDHHWV
jgi:hypothetical protein